MENNELNDHIYMDYAAATPVSDEVLDAMEPYWKHIFGNPRALHAHGRDAAESVREHRRTIARILQCQPEEVIFTSGGTEANSLAILGFLSYLESVHDSLDDFHMITSGIEHSSVLRVFERLQDESGIDIDYLGVDSSGVVRAETLTKALKENTVLVSIMYVNSEIGTIQPIPDIARAIKKHRKETTKSREHIDDFPVLHTDATQAPLFVDMHTQKVGADLITMDAQKIYGPKGVGVLYKEEAVPLRPLFLGGGQEHGLRPGTENTQQIAGMAKALELADSRRESFSAKMSSLQQYFLERLEDHLPDARLNGGRQERVPNNINISFPDTDHEFLATQLDDRGISVATKSACLEGGVEGSHVIEHLTERDTTSALRFTLGRGNTKEEIDYVIEQLREIRNP